MMAALSANFSLPAAKPPAQKIGVAGFDAKLFGADSAPQLPPAPTVAQLCERPFAPEMLRFYLTKRQAEQIHSAASVEGEVWRYTWGGRTRDVKLPLPKDGQEAEQKAVMTIADTEGLDEVPIRTYIAQVVSANWHDFLRGVAEAQQPRPQPGIPAQLLNMLEQQAVLQEPKQQLQ